MIPRTLSLAMLLLLALAAVACGSGRSSDAKSQAADGTPAPRTQGASGGGSTADGAGALIIAKPQGLVEYTIRGGATKTLIAAPGSNSFLLDPAISPDAKQLAYVVQPPPRIEGTTYDAGSDLWVANRDGSNPRAVFVHNVANQLVRYPQWQDAGHVLAIVQEITKQGGRTNVVYTLERVDVATGARTHVVEDVLAFGVSPDGKRAVYARLAPQTGETLEAMDLTGGGTPATLIGIDQNLSPFNSPRYAPDGAKIAFASADQTGARSSLEYVTARVFAPAPGRVLALDGLPEDIWTIDAGGGAPVRVAALKEDLPAITWSGDGQHLYVLGAAGLYDVNLGNGATTRLGDGAFHAQAVWTP